MKEKIVIAGGTGFIGKYFKSRFEESGCEVLIISRQKGHINWNDHHGLVEALENASMLINLAGKSVNCRYNTANKKAIMESRTQTTAKLCNAIKDCTNPPSLWLNSSTATIYRHAEDRPMTEAEGEIGTGFSVDVATNWEKSFFNCELIDIRKVALRIAIVLGPGGGVMKPYQNLVKFGLGGKQGSGKQMFSWIHVEDLYRLILFIKENKIIKGPVNCSSPNPVKNKELMQTLRKAMNVSIGLPAAKWMLKMGAVLIGTETELILKSRWVIPDKLQNAGFEFNYASLDEALTQIIHSDKRTKN